MKEHGLYTVSLMMYFGDQYAQPTNIILHVTGFSFQEAEANAKEWCAWSSAEYKSKGSTVRYAIDNIVHGNKSVWVFDKKAES